MAYVVSEPNLCLSYNKWGRPNPPYVVFKFAENAWQRIDIAQLPVELSTFNLMISYGNEVMLANALKPLGYVSAQTIERSNAENHREQPVYRSILREPVAAVGNWCPAMVSYGKAGGWIGLDWFTDQPSLSACLEFCKRKNVSEETCPCGSIFKGEK